MGLDCVELILSVEESFGIRIPNEAAARLETPGLLIDYIHGLLGSGSNSPECLTQRAFYRLRKAFVDEGLCSRAEFRPDSDLDRIVPPSGRRRFWHKLGSHYEMNPDQLELPAAVAWSGLLTITITSGWIATRVTEAISEWIGCFILSAIPLGLALNRLASPLKRCIPNESLTPAGMVMRMVQAAPARFTRNGESLSREQIAATVKAITLAYCRPQDYREDAHFVRDLGLD